MKSLDSKTGVSGFFGKRLFIALIAVLLSVILGLTSVAVVSVRAEDNNDTLITYDSPDSKVWSKIEILDESRENVVMDVLANNKNKPYLEQGKTYYLRAYVKKPKNATRFHFLVGDTKDKGITATYNGVKVVSPPGGATNTGPMESNSFDYFYERKDLDDPKYGYNETSTSPVNKRTLNDGYWEYGIKSSIATNEEYEVLIGFEIDPSAYNNVDVIDGAIHLYMSDGNHNYTDQISINIPVEKNTSSTFPTGMGSSQMTPGGVFQKGVSISASNLSYMYEKIEFDFVYSKELSFEDFGFNDQYVKYSYTGGKITIGNQESVPGSSDMVKRHIVVHNGLMNNLMYLNYKVRFPKDSVKIGSTYETYFSNGTIKYYNNDITESIPGDGKYSYTIVDPTLEKISYRATDRTVYNATEQTENYMTQFGSLEIYNDLSNESVKNKVLEVNYNKNKANAEILAITVPVGSYGLEDNKEKDQIIYITGTDENGNSKTVTLNGSDLSYRNYLFNGWPIYYYRITAKDIGLKNITYMKTYMGKILPLYHTTTWDAYWSTGGANACAAFGRFTSTDPGIVVTNEYKIYNELAEDRELPKGNVTIPVTVTGTSDNRVAASGGYSIYSIDNRGRETYIGDKPYIPAGGKVKGVMDITPYGTMWLAETDGKTNSDGVYKPVQSANGTSAIITDPEMYLILPQGIDISDLSFSLSKSNQFNMHNSADRDGAKSSDLNFSIESVPNTKDDKKIYKVTFPKDTVIGLYDADGNITTLRVNITLSTVTGLPTDGYRWNDLVQIKSSMDTTGMVYNDANSIGATNNLRPDKYGINGGKYLLGVTNGSTEKKFNIQQLSDIQVEDSITVTKINGVDVSDNHWFVLNTVDGKYDENSIALLGKKSEGQLKIQIRNQSDSASGAYKTFIPIPKEGTSLGTAFQENNFGFTMSLDSAYIPEGFTIKYVKLNKTDVGTDGSFNTDGQYIELSDDNKDQANAILLESDSVPGNANVSALFNFKIDDGKPADLNVFRTIHKYYPLQNDSVAEREHLDNYVAMRVATARLTGTVFHDTNSNGIMDDGEEGIEGITVVVEDKDGGKRTAVTGADGRYTYEAVREDDITVEFKGSNSDEKIKNYRFNVKTDGLNYSNDKLSASKTYESIGENEELNIPMNTFVSIKYDANAPENVSVTGDVPKTQEAAENEYINVKGKPDNLTASGYMFTGWNTKPDGSGDTYRANSSLSVSGDIIKDGTITLYAMWEEAEYNLTFDYAGGTPYKDENIDLNNFKNFKIKISDRVDSASLSDYKLDNYLSDKLAGILKIKSGLPGNGNNYLFPINDWGYGNAYLPTKLGYTFGGWDFNGSGSKSLLGDTTFNNAFYVGNRRGPVTDDITYRAIWNEKKDYKITFDPNGGELKSGDIVYTTENKYTKGNIRWTESDLASDYVPVKNGYTFAGWSYDGEVINGNTQYRDLAGNDDSSDKVITLTAEWVEKNDYTVKYSVPGMSIPDKTVSYTSKDIYPEQAIKSENANEYFAGWTLKASDASESDIIASGTTFKDLVEGDNNYITLYPVFKTKADGQVTVNYNSNGGTSAASTVINRDDQIKLPTVSRTGYTFDHWEYEGRRVDDNTVYSGIEGSKDDITLDAVWKENHYSVKYVVFGDDGNESESKTIDNVHYESTGFDEYKDGDKVWKPERAGYTFDGWVLNGTKKIVMNNMSYGSLAGDEGTEQIVLAAKFTPLNYTVEFDRENGEASYIDPIKNLKYGDVISISTKQTKTGYELEKYQYKNSDGTMTDINSGVTKISDLKPETQTLTLYPVWSIRGGYTVAYDVNGGNADKVPESKTNVYWNTADLLNVNVQPERTGYTLSGWTYGSSVVNNIVTYGELARDGNVKSITLVAQWTPRTDVRYTVEYYKENPDGSYSLDSASTESKSGTTNEKVSINTLDSSVVNKFDRYHISYNNANNNLSDYIKPDGSLVLKIYYDINEAEVSFNLNPNPALESDVPAKQFVKYGKHVTKVNDPVKVGYTFGGWYLSPNPSDSDRPWNFDSDTITAENSSSGKVTLYAKWTAKNYTVSYNINGGDPTTKPADKSDVRWNDNNLTDVAEPKREMYEFAGWKYGDTYVSASDKYSDLAPNDTESGIELVAQWNKANSYYTVKYFKQNLENDGYTEVESDRMILTGKVGEEVHAAVKNYNQYHLKDSSVLTAVLPEEDTTVIEVYYDLNTYNVNYNLNGATNPDGDYAQKTVKYGTEITLEPEVAKDKYKFIKYTVNGEDHKPGDKYTVTGNTDIVAVLDRKTESLEDVSAMYIVASYKEDINGQYHLVDNSVNSAHDLVGKTVTANVEDIAHYHLNTEKSVLSGVIPDPREDLSGKIIPMDDAGLENIEKTGKVLVLKVYYDLDEHEVSYDLGGGTNGDTDYSEVKVKYGSEITLKDNPERDDSIFENYTVDGDGNAYEPGDKITITGNTVIKANYNRNTTYKVNYYKEDMDGNYNLVEDDSTTRAGIINDKVTADILNYDNYELNSEKSDIEGYVLKPDADGNGLVLNVYYDIVKHNIKFNFDGGNFNNEGELSESAKHGSKFTITEEPLRDGYKFMYYTDGTDKYYIGDVLDMSGDIELTAVWEKIDKGDNDSHGGNAGKGDNVSNGGNTGKGDNISNGENEDEEIKLIKSDSSGKAVKTGDYNYIPLWTAIASLSVAAGVSAVIINRRRNGKKNKK